MPRIQTTTKRPKIVTIGGGTGHFTVLSGLKHHDVDITAVMSMMDSGGSAGELRDELGVLPPGDLRQCLVALSEEDAVMRKLFAHRFSSGRLSGHTCGNLLISALEQITGSIDSAVAHAAHILNIRGRVVPVTRDTSHLIMTLKNGKVLSGEHAIDYYQLISRFGVASLTLAPRARLHPDARKAIKEADLIVVGPGDLYTSLLPNFLVTGMQSALRASRAKKVFVSSLMNKHGQTDDMGVHDFVSAIDTAVGEPCITHAIYNTATIPKVLREKYVDEGIPVSMTVPQERGGRCTYIGTPLLAARVATRAKGDMLARSLIRHDPHKLAAIIVGLV